MESLRAEGALEEDAFEVGAQRADLNLDFVGSDSKIMDSAELDKMLREESGNGSMGFSDSDIDKMMNPSDITLDGVTEDALDWESMPIAEVEDPQVDNILVNNTGSEQAMPQVRGPNLMPQKNDRSAVRMERAADPLLGHPVRKNNQMNMEISRPSMMHQQTPLENFGAQVDALQRMVDQAVMTGHGNPSVPNGVTNNPNMRFGDMQQAIGRVDLEQEKLKLLQRLNEINQRQNANQMVSQSNFQQSHGSNGLFVHKQQQQQQQLHLQQQQQQAKSGPGVASIGGIKNSGETPLTSFLRKGQKSPTPTARATVGQSMLAAKLGSAPKAASIFAEAPMEFESPLLQRKGNQGSRSNLFGAMDRAAASQDMIRKLSAKNLLVQSEPGHNIGLQGVAGQNGGVQGNAAWGNDPSFKTSGILPKHASETQLFRASRGGMARSRSKAGSVSRENLLYNHMKKSNSRGSMHKSNSRGSMHKSNSRGSLQMDDSLGQLLPVKRRMPAGGKHKLGLSRSVPHMMMNNNAGRGGSPTDGTQKNAMW